MCWPRCYFQLVYANSSLVLAKNEYSLVSFDAGIHFNVNAISWPMFILFGKSAGYCLGLNKEGLNDYFVKYFDKENNCRASSDFEYLHNNQLVRHTFYN